MSIVKREFSGEVSIQDVFKELVTVYFDAEGFLFDEVDENISVTHKKSSSNLKVDDMR